MKRNGYRPSHRNKWLFLAHKIISSQALLLWEYYIDQMDFDPKHTGYGSFEYNIQDIAQVFHCSENTVRNWHNELVKKKIVFRHNKKGYFKLLHPERYIQRNSLIRVQADTFARSEKDQPIELIFQYISEDLQSVEKFTQPVGVNNAFSQTNVPSKALGSFKVDYSSKSISSYLNKESGFDGFNKKDNSEFTDQDRRDIDQIMDTLINPEKK